MSAATHNRSSKSAGRGAPGRTRVPRAVREREMVTAARGIFGERGYDAVSMDELAAAVGVTKPMLYSYFGSKEGLFAECVRQAGAELRATVEKAAGSVGDQEPEMRLWRGLLAVFTGIEQNRDAWDLLYPLDTDSPTGVLGARASSGVTAMTALVESLMADAAREGGVPDELVGEAAPLAAALTAAVLALTDWWRRHPEEPKELQAIRAMNLAWRGFEGVLSQGVWLPREI